MQDRTTIKDRGTKRLEVEKFGIPKVRRYGLLKTDIAWGIRRYECIIKGWGQGFGGGRGVPRELGGNGYMFERYTEKARRVIFFARYEASQFGSPYIETEHLLLGLLREDKALTNRFLRSHASVESIRKQ